MAAKGKRIFGRYCVELLELRFVVTEDDLQNGALHLTQGKVYFQGGYYQNLDLGDVLISAAGTVVDDSAVPRHSMAYISIGEFSERPYFFGFWAGVGLFAGQFINGYGLSGKLLWEAYNQPATAFAILVLLLLSVFA